MASETASCSQTPLRTREVLTRILFLPPSTSLAPTGRALSAVKLRRRVGSPASRPGCSRRRILHHSGACVRACMRYAMFGHLSLTMVLLLILLAIPPATSLCCLLFLQ